MILFLLFNGAGRKVFDCFVAVGLLLCICLISILLTHSKRERLFGGGTDRT